MFIFGLLFLPLFLVLFSFLADLGGEIILQNRVHNALETALEASAQAVDQVANQNGCLVLDPAGVKDTFQTVLLAALNSPGLVSGPGYWEFAPPSSSFNGPIEVDGFQVYNTNHLKQNADGSYSCESLRPPLGITTPWGMIVDRPSVYADLKVPVVLPTGRQVILDVFAIAGANTPS